MEYDIDGAGRPRHPGAISLTTKGVPMRFKSFATDSMPERLQVTQQIELRKQQQAEADKKAAEQAKSRAAQR